MQHSRAEHQNGADCVNTGAANVDEAMQICQRIWPTQHGNA